MEHLEKKYRESYMLRETIAFLRTHYNKYALIRVLFAAMDPNIEGGMIGKC